MSSPDIKHFRDKNIGKLTMKEPYSKTKYLSIRIRAVLDLFRPFTLLAPVLVSMSIMVASLLYFKNTVPGFVINESWWFWVGNASLTIAIVNAASNSLNQATDVESDKISKPYRPIPQGILKADEAQSIAYILYLFALIRAITLDFWFGVFIFLIMLFTVTYSLPPRTKKYLLINQIWIAIPRGLLGILASWSVFLPDETVPGMHPFQPVPMIIGGIATLYLIGGMSTKDITDSKADKLTGTKTLINTFGIKKTAIIVLPFITLPFLIIPFGIYLGILEYYLWPLSLLAVLGVIIVYLMIKSTENKYYENVKAWSLMYIQYILYAMGFSLLTIFGEFFYIPKVI